MIRTFRAHQQVTFAFKVLHGTVFNEILALSYQLAFVFGLKQKTRVQWTRVFIC